MTMTPRFLIAAVTALVSSAVIAAPATAADLGGAEDLRYKTSSITLAGGSETEPQHEQLYTHCGKGWRAVSGGQTISAKAGHAIADTAPTGLRYWYGSAWQSHPKPSTLTQHSVCLRTDDLTLSSAGEFDLAPNSQVTDQVTCTEGYAVSGGVVTVGDGTDFSLNASYPVDDGSDADLVPDDGWRSFVQYSGEGGGDDAVFHGLCVGGARPAYRSATVSVPAFSTVKAQALCPKHRPAMGGGVYVNGLANLSHVVASRPWDGSDAGTVPEDGWLAATVNTSDSTLTMTVHAICR